LGNIKSAYDKNESLENLLLDNFFTDAINKCQQGWRKVIATATVYGTPIPCLSTGKTFVLFYCKKLYLILFLSFGFL
jgi:6-phosphogluconate dehydrogenase